MKPLLQDLTLRAAAPAVGKSKAGRTL